MNRAESIARLPGAYGYALFLHESGLPDEAIAHRLDIELSAVPNLLALAEAKLRAVTGSTGEAAQASEGIEGEGP